MLRIAWALAFLAAQLAPALHGIHADPEEDSPCRDGEQAAHFCSCDPDHDAPPCIVCAHASGGSMPEGILAWAIASCNVPGAPAPDPAPSVDFVSASAPRGPPSAS